MPKANTLVPATTKELEGADQLLAALTDIAYATEPTVKVKKRERKHRSRFFFRLTKSIADEVKDKQKQSKPKTRVHIDHEVEKRLSDYRQDMPSELEKNIAKVREFFLREIAPITLAAGAGSGQALEVVKRLVGTDIDGTQFDKFERMAAKAVDIKMARFICKQFGLGKAEAEDILEAMKPRLPSIVPIGVPNERQKQVREEAQKAPDVP